MWTGGTFHASFPLLGGRNQQKSAGKNLLCHSDSVFRFKEIQIMVVSLLL